MILTGGGQRANLADGIAQDLPRRHIDLMKLCDPAPVCCFGKEVNAPHLIEPTKQISAKQYLRLRVVPSHRPAKMAKWRGNWLPGYAAAQSLHAATECGRKLQGSWLHLQVLHEPPSIFGQHHGRCGMALAKRRQISRDIRILVVDRHEVQPAIASQVFDVCFNDGRIELRTGVDANAGPMPCARKDAEVGVALQ